MRPVSLRSVADLDKIVAEYIAFPVVGPRAAVVELWFDKPLKYRFAATRFGAVAVRRRPLVVENASVAERQVAVMLWAE